MMIAIAMTAGSTSVSLFARRLMRTIMSPNDWAIVKDGAGQKLAHVYFEGEPGRRSAAKLLKQRRGVEDLW
jgi:hypothetical protein